MNFFSIFFSLCSGVSIFPKLVRRPLRFAFLHLFLLLTFCTIGVTVAHYVHRAGLVNETTERFFSRTGEIGVTKNRLILSKSPEVTRSYVAGDFRFDYFAAPADFTPEALQESRSDFNLLFFPSGLAFRMKDFADPDSPHFRMVLCSPAMLCDILTKGVVSPSDLDTVARDRNRVLTVSEVYETIRKRLLDPGEQKAAGQDGPEAKVYLISAKDVSSQINLLLSMMSLLFFLMEAVMALLLSITFFSLAQMLRSVPESGKIPYKVLLITTIYATFPPLFIASLAQALELTFPSFQMLFFIAFFLYQIFAFKEVFQSFDHSSGPASTDGRPPEN